MKHHTRRTFLKASALSVGSVAMLAGSPFGNPLKRPGRFGFQTWTIREAFNTNPEATCQNMASLGYSELEMCSPLGYKNAGFAPLGKYSGKELNRLFNANGLACTSSHFTFGELKDNLDDRIAWALDLGLKQMILSTFWLPEEEQTVDHYRRAADELNNIAEKTKAAGIQMGFHNHHMEFEEKDGRLIYDVLLDAFIPELVKMQFQVAVVDIGYKAADYFRKYPGRFISAHLSDYSKQKEQQVPIGQGEVNWEEFLKAAKIGGVKNMYVEMAPETFQESAEFLSTQI